MFEPAPAFIAGLSARHDDAAIRLRRVLGDRPAGFSPGDLIARIEEAFSSEAGPKSYAPANPATNPTEGWDPLDPTTPAALPIACWSAAWWSARIRCRPTRCSRSIRALASVT